MHEYAFKAAQASVCAKEQGRFWEYHDRLFCFPDLSVNALNRAAAEIGLLKTEFDRCMASDNSSAAVIKDIEEAEGLGVSRTPTFFVNGRAVKGAASFELLKQAIDLALLGEHHSTAKGVPQPKDVGESPQRDHTETNLPLLSSRVLIQSANELAQRINWTIALSMLLIAISLGALFSFYYVLGTKVNMGRTRCSIAAGAFLLSAITSAKLILLVGCGGGSNQGLPTASGTDPVTTAAAPSLTSNTSLEVALMRRASRFLFPPAPGHRKCCSPIAAKPTPRSPAQDGTFLWVTRWRSCGTFASARRNGRMTQIGFGAARPSCGWTRKTAPAPKKCEYRTAPDSLTSITIDFFSPFYKRSNWTGPPFICPTARHLTTNQ